MTRSSTDQNDSGLLMTAPGDAGGDAGGDEGCGCGCGGSCGGSSSAPPAPVSTPAASSADSSGFVTAGSGTCAGGACLVGMDGGGDLAGGDLGAFPSFPGGPSFSSPFTSSPFSNPYNTGLGLQFDPFNSGLDLTNLSFDPSTFGFDSSGGLQFGQNYLSAFELPGGGGFDAGNLGDWLGLIQSLGPVAFCLAYPSKCSGGSPDQGSFPSSNQDGNQSGNQGGNQSGNQSNDDPWWSGGNGADNGNGSPSNQGNQGNQQGNQQGDSAASELMKYAPYALVGTAVVGAVAFAASRSGGGGVKPSRKGTVVG